MVACEPRAHPPESLRCPRCDSADTKFCYYNNYNTSQPRHFCKSCKRYWTAGGTLRNVPVGGGLRKNKKCKIFNHVKDMISSSSPDELFHGNLSLANPYGIPQDGFSYDVPRPLAYAPPLVMASPSSSTDVPGDGNLGNPHAYRNLNSVSFGYFGENRLDGDYAMPGMDPPHAISSNVRHHAQSRGDYSRAWPEGIQLQSNGSFHGLVGVDQAQSHSGGLSEAPSEPSQASSDVVKDPNSSHSGELLQTDVHQFEHGQACREALKHFQGEEAVVAGVTGRQQNIHKPNQSWEKGNIPHSSEEVMLLQESQLREKASTEEEDDELGNVVNVRYPYDWEQVSEVLFGGTPDFFQLSTY